jgi:citrate lyase beta subunit
MFASAKAAGADLIHFDLEDSVLPSQRQFAREMILDNVGGLETWGLRVNKYDTEDYRMDVEAFAGLASFYFIPKVESFSELYIAAKQLRGPVVAIIETARGLQRVDEILQYPSPAVGAVFGESDFCASMGWSYRQCDWARQKFLLAAKAAKLRAIASPWPWTDGICVTSEHEGFDGQICLNPEQVKRVNACYSPSAQDIWTAKHILAQHDVGKNNFYMVPPYGKQRLLLANEYTYWAWHVIEAARHHGCDDEGSPVGRVSVARVPTARDDDVFAD